jgi:hypothetical protein
VFVFAQRALERGEQAFGIGVRTRNGGREREE